VRVFKTQNGVAILSFGMTKVEELVAQAKIGSKSVQVMSSDIEGINIRAKSMRQTAAFGSGSVEQTMLKNVKVTGDIDLGDLIQEA
jgi:hypothetical protein